MKKQTANKYMGTRFNAVKRHSGTHEGKESPQELSTVIPAYNTQGKDFLRVLPPVRDHQDIDLQILEQVLADVLPQFDMSRLILKHGMCEIGQLKFRFTDMKDLLRNLQDQLDCSDYIRKSVEYRYNREFNNKKFNANINKH